MQMTECGVWGHPCHGGPQTPRNWVPWCRWGWRDPRRATAQRHHPAVRSKRGKVTPALAKARVMAEGLDHRVCSDRRARCDVPAGAARADTAWPSSPEAIESK